MLIINLIGNKINNLKRIKNLVDFSNKNYQRSIID